MVLSQEADGHVVLYTAFKPRHVFCRIEWTPLLSNSLDYFRGDGDGPNKSILVLLSEFLSKDADYHVTVRTESTRTRTRKVRYLTSS